jgi:hypothetical protein
MTPSGSGMSLHLIGKQHVEYIVHADLYVIWPEGEYNTRITMKGDDALALAREIIRVAEMRPAIEEVK